jgi:hypothetical protein
MRREKMANGGGTYLVFTKNRNGQSDMKWSYQLSNNDIHYGYIIDETEDEEIESIEVTSKKEFKLNRSVTDIIVPSLS